MQYLIQDVSCLSCPFALGGITGVVGKARVLV